MVAFCKSLDNDFSKLWLLLPLCSAHPIANKYFFFQFFSYTTVRKYCIDCKYAVVPDCDVWTKRMCWHYPDNITLPLVISQSGNQSCDSLSGGKQGNDTGGIIMWRSVWVSGIYRKHLMDAIEFSLQTFVLVQIKMNHFEWTFKIQNLDSRIIDEINLN